MTHNRKPDVLPAEGASTADALEALEVLRYFVNAPPVGVLPQVKAWKATDTIRSALERAAAEGEAWRVIEEWLRAGHRRDIVLTPLGVADYCSGEWGFELLDGKRIVREMSGYQRTVCLEKAADWVKAQALPAPPRGSTP